MENYSKYIILFFVAALLLGGVTNCVSKQKIKCNTGTNCEAKCNVGTDAQKNTNIRIDKQAVTILQVDIINHKHTIADNLIYNKIKSKINTSISLYILDCKLLI